MFEKLTELIATGDLNGALYELQEEYFHIEERSLSDAGKLCVLEASLWEALGDFGAEISALSKALTYDYTNYEAYFMLGLYYMEININKAYLCLEMALFYCSDEEDLAVIESSFYACRERQGLRVRNTSIMILSYNDLDLVKKCIGAIEEYVPEGSAEIVVVDNASSQDGVLDYLREKKNDCKLKFTLVESKENLGFPKGCNLGASYCHEDNDIFFLNNDAVLMPLALFWLRMGLYENRNVGACSALSNSASLQEIPYELLGQEDVNWHKKMDTDAALLIFEKYALQNHGILSNPYIKTFRLTGFALLLSRMAIVDVAPDGCVFDEMFSPGYFEDDDLGIRLARCGYQQYICRNSFIYHNGGSGFSGHSDAMELGKKKFEDKWGFDIWGFSLPWKSACDEVLRISAEKKGMIKVLDFSCGLGINASYIKGNNPNVFVAGVCDNTFAAGIAANVVDSVAVGDLNTTKLPFDNHSFDIVIAEKRFVSTGQAMRYLKSDGKYINEEEFEF